MKIERCMRESLISVWLSAGIFRSGLMTSDHLEPHVLFGEIGTWNCERAEWLSDHFFGEFTSCSRQLAFFSSSHVYNLGRS